MGTRSPWSTPSTRVVKKSAGKGLSLSEVALFGVLGGLTFAAKMAMAGLANIEPVSLMVMLFAVTFGRKAAYPIYVYVLMEYVTFGFGLWTFNYLYIWLVPALAAWLVRGMTNPFGWAVLSGLFGLSFGALCAPVDLFVGGWNYAVIQWANGIPLDIAHCVGNFAIALLLFVPLRRVLERLYQGMGRGRPLRPAPTEPPPGTEKSPEQPKEAEPREWKKSDHD